MGLDYEAQLKSTDNYEVKGQDKFCNKPITEPKKVR
jgi:NitT/TauT family transport system substrate-binding protein